MQQDASSDHAENRPRTTEGGPTEVPFEPQIHAVIADHKLLRRIGRGSYGEVWLARHTMGMYRAVKIVHRRYFKDRHPFERELSGIRKFEPISRSHRGFIDILHVGMHEGGDYFYYVMELGDDQNTGSKIDPDTYWPKTLSRELRSHGTLDYQHGLQLGLDLSRALAELHRNGLVHRDIKPSNILFVNSVPKLADIGLVSQADEACSYVGTEGFIPPEGPGTARADVYALGKVLYEAITGKDRLDYPELPLDWDARVAHEKLRELNEVILQACNDAPKRYPTAEDMHADLVVLLAGKSVRRLKSLERQVSQLKHLGALCSLTGLAAAIIIAVISHERGMALRIRQAQVANLVAHGDSAADAGDLGGALPYFAETLALNEHDHQRVAEDRKRFSSVISQYPKIVQMWFVPKPVYEVGIAADGRRVLTAEYLGQAHIFDADTGRQVTPGLEQGGLLRGNFSANGSLVATVGEDNTACVWSSLDGKLVKLLFCSDFRALCVNFSPDDRHMVTGCTDNQARVWDTATWTCTMNLVGHTKAVLYATYSHDGKLIATSSRDHTVRIWDALTGQQLGEPLIHSKWVDLVTFSPDDRFLVTACQDRKARVWNTRTHERIPPDIDHDEVVSSVCYSPDGRLIVTGCFDGTARIWLAADHQPFAQAPILRHSDKVKHVAFFGDGHRIITGCTDGSVRIWDLAGMQLGTELKLHCLSEDGSRFLTLENGCVQVRDVVSGRVVSCAIGAKGRVIDARLSADGGTIVTLSRAVSSSEGSLPNLVELWRTDSGARMGPPVLWSNSLSNIKVSTNGKRLLGFGQGFAHCFQVPGCRHIASWAVGADTQSALLSPEGTRAAIWNEQTLSLFDTDNGKMIGVTPKHPFPLTDVHFSRDGLKLVTCGADSTLAPCYAQIWDSISAEKIGGPLSHADGVLCSIFSPKADLLLTGGEDSRAIVWQSDSGNQRVFIKHRDKVTAAAFSEDELSFSTASLDKTARIWSTETAAALTPALRHHSAVNGVTILADGVHLITLDSEHRAWLWSLSGVQHSLDDVMRLSRLLSGASVLPMSTAGPLLKEPLSQTWQHLRERHPGDFAVSSDNIANWYDYQAEESELEGNPAAAIFYLEHLNQLKPAEESISARLMRATQKATSLSEPGSAGAISVSH